MTKNESGNALTAQSGVGAVETVIGAALAASSIEEVGRLTAEATNRTRCVVTDSAVREDAGETRTCKIAVGCSAGQTEGRVATGGAAQRTGVAH